MSSNSVDCIGWKGEPPVRVRFTAYFPGYANWGVVVPACQANEIMGFAPRIAKWIVEHGYAEYIDEAA